MSDFQKWPGCISGALDREVYLDKLRRAGFTSVQLIDQFTYEAYKTDTYAAFSISLVATK